MAASTHGPARGLAPRILLIGTADTKSDEIAFLDETIRAQGAQCRTLDVGVLGGGACRVDIPNDEVARAAGYDLATVRASTDENEAMSRMALGAARIAAGLQAAGEIDGMLALGGTMGTDLALTVASALPLGVPKVVLSTVAGSPLIAPDRISPDIITVLWAGGLYGLNELCRATLAQAAGAVVGAARAARRPGNQRPLVGMTSLGKSCLSYMVELLPALQARGFEVAVFHTTGMGGRAFEAMAREGRFAAVFDFSLQELANEIGGSAVSAGADRLLGAGAAGVPQLVAPGAADMIDFPAWMAAPASVAGRPVHVHNRLIASATSPPALRARIAGEIVERLATARGPTCLLLPVRGIQAWDRPGEPLHDPAGLRAFVDALRQASPGRIDRREVDAHINDRAFADAALAVFDEWVARGVIRTADHDTTRPGA